MFIANGNKNGYKSVYFEFGLQSEAMFENGSTDVMLIMVHEQKCRLKSIVLKKKLKIGKLILFQNKFCCF